MNDPTQSKKDQTPPLFEGRGGARPPSSSASEVLLLEEGQAIWICDVCIEDADVYRYFLQQPVEDHVRLVQSLIKAGVRLLSEAAEVPGESDAEDDLERQLEQAQTLLAEMRGLGLPG